jgi:hypothetical protein
MTDESPRKPWGVGRVAFMGRLDAIRAGIQKGLPLTAIYDEHKAALGIGYPSFVKLVGRYASDARVTRRRSRTEPPKSPSVPQAASGAQAQAALPSKPLSASADLHDDSAGARKRPAFRPVTPRKD